VFRALEVYKDHKDLKELQGLRVHRVHQEFKGRKVLVYP
jgi:hypothetical protein